MLVFVPLGSALGDHMMSVSDVLERLDAVKSTGQDSWTARCPAHDDHTPSLSVSDGTLGVVFHCHAGCEPETVVQALGLEFRDLFRESGNSFPEIVATYPYVDEDSDLLFHVVRQVGKKFFRRRPDGNGGWIWKLGDTRRVLYRLPQLIEAVAFEKLIHIVEGEKDVHEVEEAGGVATTLAGGAIAKPPRWLSAGLEPLRGARVRIVADRDEPGLSHARLIAAVLEGVAEQVEIVQARVGKDATDHLAAGLGLDDFEPVTEEKEQDADAGVTVEDFWAYLPMHSYVFVPTREPWPASSVNAKIAPIPLVDAEGNAVLDEDGEQVILKANAWLDQKQSVEQMTWAPGEPLIIEDRLIHHGGWIDRFGCRTLNLYSPPLIELGDPAKAERWLEHTHLVFPDQANHIIKFIAQRVRRPWEKINHGLLLHGPQGTGKDTIIEGAIPTIGPWNVSEVGPDQLLGRFNGFIKSVILRVSEARDLGDSDRYRLYDHLKTLMAAPPDVLRCDEKHLREYAVPNVCGVVITSNHRDGIYLPADDRRHFVAWTELTKEYFTESYWKEMYAWYEREGYKHVAAYLTSLDISDFNSKAPPPKTDAFWAVVDAGRSPEDAEMADALESLGKPAATSLSMIAKHAIGSFQDWLQEKKNARSIPSPDGDRRLRGGSQRRRDGWALEGGQEEHEDLRPPIAPLFAPQAHRLCHSVDHGLHGLRSPLGGAMADHGLHGLRGPTRGALSPRGRRNGVAVNLAPLSQLAADLREDAATLRRYGAPGQAEAVEECAAGLEERLRLWELEALTLEQAALESGFAYSTLQQKIAANELPNAGELGAPRIRRCDLPYRGGAPRPQTDAGAPDVAKEILARRAVS